MKTMMSLTCIFILSWINFSYAQIDNKVEVNQVSVPKVSLSDSKLISFFMDEFFIPETLVTKMDIIDVSRNGFGENDIVKLYPSDNVYFLQFISDAAQKRMNQWEFKANFQITAENKDVSFAADYESNKPAYNIFGAILKGLNHNYQDLPIKIRFERDSSTVLFELWGHTENALKVIPKEEPRVKDVLLEQIAVKSDTTLYDCIFIYKTLVDTVFIRDRN